MGYVPYSPSGKFERKYGGFLLLYGFIAMLMMIGSIGLVNTSAGWWVWAILLTPAAILMGGLLIACVVFMFLAALEDYRETPNTESERDA